MPRSRIVSVDPEFPRESSRNCCTVLRADFMAAEWQSFEALFRRGCADLRSLCRRFADPGVAVVACHPRFGVTGQLCIGAKPDTINTAIVGRHREADLFLSEDPTVALRHLVVIAHRLGTASVFSVLDLRTESGFVDEEGELREAVTCDGPLFIRCRGYALFLLPTAVGRALPDDAERAWNELPPRRVVPARFGLVKTPRPQLEPEERTEPPGTYTSVRYRPGPRALHGDLVQPGEHPIGTLHIEGQLGSASLSLGATALGEGGASRPLLALRHRRALRQESLARSRAHHRRRQRGLCRGLRQHESPDREGREAARGRARTEPLDDPGRDQGRLAPASLTFAAAPR